MAKISVKRVTPLVLAVAIPIILLLFAPSEMNAAGEIPYIEADGSLQQKDSSDVTVLDQAFFNALNSASLPYVLDDAAGGWYLVTGTIDLTGAYAGTITISGNVHLILENGCSLTVQGTAAGVNVTGTDALNIYAQSDNAATAGAMTVNGGSGAGIGGNPSQTAGIITINGGTITANAGSNSAGIGGAVRPSGTLPGGGGGTITINGGTVNATGHAMGAGIGGGQSNGPGGSVGTVVINGGIVTAIGGGPAGQGLGGAGIGMGGGNAATTASGSITINGGIVTAIGMATNLGGAGIGGGRMSAGPVITITGGDVTAIGGGGGAGIGGSSGYAGGTITITGGNVTATGSKATAGNAGFRDAAAGAGIGGGYLGAGGTITITGGTVVATGSGGWSNNYSVYYYSAGIGGGSNNQGGTILIYGEDTDVTAISGGGTAGDIGAGHGSSGGSIFAAVPKGNLRGTGDIELGNVVNFTADPATAAGIVRTTLPAPFSTTIDLLNGLGSGSGAKDMSVLTTLGGSNISFALAGYSNSPVVKTGTYLMTDPSPFIEFIIFYTVNVEVAAGDGSFTIRDGAVVLDTVLSGAPARDIIIPYTVLDLILTPDAAAGYRFEKFVVDGVDITAGPATVPISADMIIKAYFIDETTFPTLYRTVTVTIEGEGSVTISEGGVTYGTITTLTSVGVVNVPIAITSVTLTATPAVGNNFLRWEIDINGNTNPHDLSMTTDKYVKAVFGPTPPIPPIPPTRDYYITATADSGSTITPSGVVTVSGGSDQTFTFEAKPGYVIIEVWIDGLHLLPTAQMDLGTYTFTRVMANHTISVKSIVGSRTDVILRIDVVQGQGHAEYEVDGSGTFIRYTDVVVLPAGTNLVVVGFPDDLYVFDRWETPSVERTEEISFTNLRGPLHLKLYFIPEDSGKTDNNLIWGILGLLMIVGLLILLFLLWIRSGLFLTITREEAVKDASVTYRIEYKGNTSNDIKLSNSRGKMRIAAKKGAVVTITMAAKDGSVGVGLPLIVVMENRREYREIILR